VRILRALLRNVLEAFLMNVFNVVPPLSLLTVTHEFFVQAVLSEVLQNDVLAEDEAFC
jgi:hypothetical protein